MRDRTRNHRNRSTGRSARTTAVTLSILAVATMLGGCVTGPFAPDYAGILESSPPYTSQIHLGGIEFSWQQADDPLLAQVRESYGLDSVAGSGTDRDRIIRLMEWMHATVPHDGGSNPPAWNIFDVIRYHEETGRGVNCRKLAISLTEVYLAMGYPAMHVTCKPQPTEFSDCHVVTAVWVPDESRWIMVDPSFRAYVTNEAGTILGVPEFREALRTGTPVSLNDDASLHGMPYPERAYLRYMTKNLYRYDLPVDAAFGYETPGNDTRYVEVVPQGYGRPGVYSGERAGGATWTFMITDNPGEVWGAASAIRGE